MKSLRNLVFDTLRNDATMNTAGITTASLYPIFSRDSPPVSVEGTKFAILRWGPAGIGIGNVIPVDLDFWVYNRDPDYDPIMDALLHARVLLAGLEGLAVDVAHTGWVNGVNWQGGTADLYDPLYEAYTRSESYRITASGN